LLTTDHFAASAVYSKTFPAGTISIPGNNGGDGSFLIFLDKNGGEEFDSRLTAYWEEGNCGVHGNDLNWQWCGQQAGDCALTVATDICDSGEAELAHYHGTGAQGSYVDESGCRFWYLAQYRCVPHVAPTDCYGFSADACREAASALGLTLGGVGYDFAGDYHTKGCYAYTSGQYAGHAYYGQIGGADVTSSSQHNALNNAAKYRVAGTFGCTARMGETEFIGCFVDDGARDFGPWEGNRDNSATNTFELCRAACGDSVYMALQYGGECFCSDTYGNGAQYVQVDESECNVRVEPCSSTSYNCGGTWRQAIYRINAPPLCPGVDTTGEWTVAVGAATSAHAGLDVGQECFNAMFAACPVVRYTNAPMAGSPAIYVRHSGSYGGDAHALFTYLWAHADNEFHTDFDIYSNMDDARSGSNPWSFCNFSDQPQPNHFTVGFPRDCGPTGYQPHIWFHATRASGTQTSGFFEVFTGSNCPAH